jgi:hypothetical protein
MAINSQKLLPGSGALARVQKTNATKEKKVSDSLRKELLLIKNKLIQIDKLLLSNSLLQKKTLEIKRKQEESARFRKREERLEKRKDKEVSKGGEIETPQLGIFDRINRFITFTFLGWLVNKFIKYTPQVLDFVKRIEPVVNFIESFVGNTFKGIVDFIDWGYNAYDQVRDFTKKIGGDPFQKTFDDFSRNLNTFINLAIVAGMATMGGTDFGIGKGGGKPGASARPGQGGRPKITTSGGGAAGRPDLRSPLRTKPTITTSGGKALGRFAGLGGRIPIIGGLVSFIISVLSGEPVGRAAAKAVGFSIGSALGTFIPVPFAGTILGGIVGDIVGGALYDTLIGNRPEKPEIKAKAKGGQVSTRKGKVVGGAIKRTERKVIQPPKGRPISPGASVGGENAIKRMFPEPTGTQIGKNMSPYGFITDTSNKMSEIPFLGPLFGLFGKVILGDTPTKTDYSNVGLGINAWINNAISKGDLQGNLIKGFADGGIIESNMKRNISGWIEKSVEELVKNKVTEAINNLRRNLGMEPLGATGSQQEPDLGEGLGVYVSSDSPDFWLLATAALFENSNPQGAADVAQAIYNRVAMPGDPWKVNNSISKAILNPGQFQPVRQYGGTAAWAAIKTKEDALRFIRSHGKTQAQLETVAAALLDKEKQNSARQFVGPRDSFRSDAYEAANDHLANDTEKSRHGHTFGFEPRGATIGAFRSGQLTAAMVMDSITGDVKFGNQSGNLKSAEELGKNMGLIITSAFRSGSRGYHGVGRALDFQSPGRPGNRGTAEQMSFARELINRYGTTIKELIYTPLGFGIKDGKKVPLTTWGPLSPPWADLPDNHPLKNSMNAIHYDHVHVAFKGGGQVGLQRQKNNINKIQSSAPYDNANDPVMMIQPIIIEKSTPIPIPNKTISFSGRGGVNSSDRISSLVAR